VNYRQQYSRLAVACALGLLGRTNGLGVIREYLTAEELWQRFACVVGLIRLRTPEALWLLTNRLEDPSPAIRALAAGALAGQGVQALADALNDRSAEVRHYAARALVFFNDPATLPALRRASHDSDAEVRTAAGLAVRRIERLAQSQPSGP